MILKQILQPALRSALKTTLWLLKIMLPITLVIGVCNFYGLIEQFSHFSSPLFSLIGLDGKAAIPFITAVFTNIYAGIALLPSLNLDYRMVTILATMCLIAHNMIVESKIQQKTGSPMFFIFPFRICMALLAGFLLNKILPHDMQGTLLLPTVEESYPSLMEMVKSWAVSNALMSIKILVIIFGLNVIQNLLRYFNLIEKLQYPLIPIMKLFGLNKSTSILWIIVNTLGLAYGGMAIMEELERGEIDPADIRLMNTSIAITHSLLEDSLLFITIGISGFWVIAPRVVLSIISVHLQRFLRKRFKISFL